MSKKAKTRTLLLIGAAVVVLYLMRGKIQGMFQGKTSGSGGNGNGGSMGGGGGSMGGGGVIGGGVQVGPYMVPGATQAEGYANIGYKPQQGEGVTALPMECISDAFTVNGVDYCIALDSRGNEVTRRI